MPGSMAQCCLAKSGGGSGVGEVGCVSLSGWRNGGRGDRHAPIEALGDGCDRALCRDGV